MQAVSAHATRTAVAGVISLLAARLVRLPEAYWAPITTLVITQSSLGAALGVSWQRFMGTLLGAALGAILATWFVHPFLAFALGVFILGFLCAAVGSDRTAYRFGGITMVIVLLVPHAEAGWRIALHRFSEVCIGIAVALLMSVVWPEKEDSTI